jgi:hypothetical protein
MTTHACIQPAPDAALPLWVGKVSPSIWEEEESERNKVSEEFHSSIPIVRNSARCCIGSYFDNVFGSASPIPLEHSWPAGMTKNASVFHGFSSQALTTESMLT